jgi:membrane protein implicated in regulation of membrane protease activity
MNTVFLACAIIGGTILVLQFALLLFGVGGDHDLGGDPSGAGHSGGGHSGEVGHDQSAFLKLFSLQTVSTFCAFFGLVGLATQSLGWSPAAVGGAAALAGIGALYFVVKLMRSLAKLQSQGNVELKNAIGLTGSVYLRIPKAGEGHGRVLMKVQGRTVECRAISRADEIPTGASIRVLDRTDDDLLVVAPAN